MLYIVVQTQVEKMRASLNPCAVPFLSRATVNSGRYYYIIYMLTKYPDAIHVHFLV